MVPFLKFPMASIAGIGNVINDPIQAMGAICENTVAIEITSCAVRFLKGSRGMSYIMTSRGIP